MHSLIDNPIICIPVLSILAIGPSKELNILLLTEFYLELN